ncbi:MAG TPA: RluA family pseudouridine synthase [Dehalococcoidia bacterium]|nr:RluA family pseudouridine synthase [Dehalococcoidia bacterium]
MSITGSREYSFIVSGQEIRLDRYVAENCPELTRNQAQRLIGDGLVQVNGVVAKASLKLSNGDRVKVTVPPPESSILEPEIIPFTVLYEDDDVLVIDKPAGLPVHPAPGHPDHTLVNAILAYLSVPPDTGDPMRPGIVHRLDMDTSGVMLVAKNRTAQASLVEQFKTHTVVKLYLVLVKGRLSPEHGVIEASIGRASHNRKRMAVVDEGRGRPARTEYRVLKYLSSYSLLEVTPETGRTHQIRVHLKAIGYPVVGDATYGVKSAFLLRQFIHASRLGFRLPSSGEYVEFEAALPPDLEKALEDIG